MTELMNTFGTGMMGGSLAGAGGGHQGLMEGFKSWLEWRKKQQPQTTQEILEGFAGSGIMGKAGKALSMTKAARMARAQEQGYLPETYYHGTQQDFPAFSKEKIGPSDIGFHVGTKQQAQPPTRMVQSGKSMFMREEPVPGSNIIPVKIKAQNPLRLKDLDTWTPSEVVPQLERAGLATKELRLMSVKHARAYDDLIYGRKPKKLAKSRLNRLQADFKKAVTGHLKKRGYDSIVYRNLNEGPGDSLMAFDPEQVRSIFAKFDPRNISSADLLAGALPFGLPAGGGLMSGRE